MSRYGAGKFRLWSGQPVNAGFVNPPVSLRVMVVASILSVTGTLVFAVANQLSMGGMQVSSPEGMGFIAICYFVVPILIAHTISMNWPVSRLLIAAYACAIAFQALAYIDQMRAPSGEKGLAATGIVLLLIMMVWWLFISRKLRVYYSLISGTGMPQDMDDPLEEFVSPGLVEGLFRKLAASAARWFEMAAVVLVFLTLAFAMSYV